MVQFLLISAFNNPIDYGCLEHLRWQEKYKKHMN